MTADSTLPTSITETIPTTAVGPGSDGAILLVDDNEGKRLALRSILTPLGHRIVEAESGVAALRCLMDEDFAVILLDVRMPIMDGFETAALIRRRRQSELTPIIFITAHRDDEIKNYDRYAEGAVDFMFAPVPPDELRSKVTVFVNLFRNASSLAVQAKESQTSANQWRLLSDAAPIGIFRTDAGNRYAYTNPRWSEITGISAERALGQKWDLIVDEGQRGQPTGGPNGERYHRFVLSAGRPQQRDVLVTSTPIPGDHGGVAGWVGTFADVTTELAAEVAMSDARDEATEASRLKSDFLANMSHEIRTPMNGVIGMTDLLLETALDARQRDYAQTVRNSAEALLTILNDILDFSKVEAGKVDLEDVSFDPRTVLEDVVDLMAGAAQAKGLELIAVAEPLVPTAINGDPGRVRQVLTNLIGNAIKFTAKGEVIVRASLASATESSAMIRFDVTDSGAGIAPEKQRLIFEPFVQGDTSTSRRYGGTGLGLSISGQLVTLMGGSCGVLSRLGEGSTFWFTVTAALDSTRDALARVSPELPAASVLVVEDNTAQRTVLCELLSDMGMSPLGVPSAADAMAALLAASAEGQPFQVAVIDRSMPGVDGMALCAAIADEAALALRVVLMTPLKATQDNGDGANLGIVATLSKPIHRDELALSMRMALLGGVLGHPHVEPPVASSPERHTGRLLLAEDNLINQKVAVAMLSSVGYVVDTVLDGAAAVRAASEHRYDAILMDCQMPEMNGYEATAAIRANEGSGRHTPIIAMTAGARREDRERCLAEGMDSYVSKPVGKDTLLALVAQFVTSTTAN
ncbi:MAG: response regulator [Acidimicrobiales bacterium]